MAVVQVTKEVTTKVTNEVVISFPSFTMDGDGKYAYGIFSETDITQICIGNIECINWDDARVGTSSMNNALSGTGNRPIDADTFFAFYDKALKQMTDRRRRLEILNNVLTLDVEFLGVEICLDEPTTNLDEPIDIGAVTLSREGREFILDVVESTLSEDKRNINCKVKADIDTFAECNFDLTKYDIIYGVEGRIFIGIGTMTDISTESITLFVRVGQTTKAIDLIIE